MENNSPVKKQNKQWWGTAMKNLWILQDGCRICDISPRNIPIH